MTRKIFNTVALALLVFASANADVNTPLQCRSKIIDVGMSMEEVRQHCGKPTSSSVDNQPVRSRNRTVGTTPVTTWHYRQPGGLMDAVLVFDVDKLRSIEYVNKMEEDL